VGDYLLSKLPVPLIPPRDFLPFPLGDLLYFDVMLPPNSWLGCLWFWPASLQYADAALAQKLPCVLDRHGEVYLEKKPVSHIQIYAPSSPSCLSFCAGRALVRTGRVRFGP